MLPIAFRVVGLNADEGAHRVILNEVRRNALPTQTMSRGPEAPPTVLSMDVTQAQFFQLRVGQLLELTPGAEEKTTALADQLRGHGNGYAQGIALR